jgi:phage tail sheath protein FI
MAETLLSPGVLTRENDQSQITQGPVTAGAAILGPTVKGPVGIPTLVTSYSDYINKFGGAFISGGTSQEYLTSISTFNYFQQGGTSLLVTRVVDETFTSATSSFISASGHDGTDFLNSVFELETLSEGIIMNSADIASQDNVKFEVTGASTGSGTFNLLIRRGNDTDNSKVILESWSNLSLDPNQPNYIEATIGNQKPIIDVDYIRIDGDYTNKSRYVRVKQVNYTTPNYFDNEGNPVAEFTGSIPINTSGSFGGATGALTDLVIDGAYYTSSISILSNKDEFRFNIITVPGQTSGTAISGIQTLASDRGDCIAVVDVTNKGDNVATAISEAASYDNSYTATYYPWVQVSAPNTGKLTWIPPSTVIPGMYAFNDRVGGPWFAPAGFLRGGLGVIQAERKLSPSDRDALYQGRVNSLATFPGQGVVAYGQKTLQKKASALDRINVRRLLIELKSFIGQIGNSLVFEQNTIATRNRFLSQVNPYLDSIQQRQGLFAYRVVMDDSNNTADVIDRNQLVGQIFIQPTRTAEFIILDFNVTPTGASFE